MLLRFHRFAAHAWIILGLAVVAANAVNTLNAAENATPANADVVRQETWKGLPYWLRTTDRGFAPPLRDMQGEAVSPRFSGGLMSGLIMQKPGAACVYQCDRDGAFYPAVQLSGSGVIEIALRLDDREYGRVVARDVQKAALFCFDRPLQMHAGQRLTLTCVRSDKPCLLEGLFFTAKPLCLPEPQIANVETWSEQPGEVEICWTTNRLAQTGGVEYGLEQCDQHSEFVDAEARNHHLFLRGLDAKKEYQARIVSHYNGEKIISKGFRFRAAPPTPPATKPQTIELTVPEPTPNARGDWPATIGMPFARGALAKTADLSLTDVQNQPVALQAAPWSLWPDGSVAWAILDFQTATQTGANPAKFALRLQPDVAPAAAPLAALKQTGQGWTLRTDRQTVVVGAQAGVLFAMQNGPDSVPVRLEMTDDKGQLWTAALPDPDSVVLEDNGPMRASLKFSGPLQAPNGTKSWRYLVRLTLYKGQAALGLDISLCHDQAQPRWREIRSWVLRLPVGGQNVQAALGGEQAVALAPGQESRLLQDNDNHFVLQSPGGTHTAEHAIGVASAASSTRQWTAVMPQFWQTYPAGFTVRPGSLDIELLPRLAADAYADPASQKAFSRLFAWFHDGNYCFRAGQLSRRQVFILPEAFAGAPAKRQAAWWSEPLLPQAAPQYLSGTGVLCRPIYAQQPGVWDAYEKAFAGDFAKHLANRDEDRTYGWMHFGDWYGERDLNYGNNEYDLAWGLGMQWMRTGRRDYFQRGLEMARHCSSVDTLYGDFTRSMPGIVWQHSFNHLGTDFSPAQLHLSPKNRAVKEYLDHYGRGMFRGALDPQGHVFQEGNWLYAALCGDRFFRDAAQRVCHTQASALTKDFNFGIERSGGWPLTNATAAYRQTSDPYYLNAARLMVQRCLEREDPVSGGWPHYPPRGETNDKAVRGGKAFAVGILSYGLLRYLDLESQPRPDVRAMLLRDAEWVRRDAWVPGRGFAYISTYPRSRETAKYGMTCLLEAEVIAYAYAETPGPARTLGEIGWRGKGFCERIFCVAVFALHERIFHAGNRGSGGGQPATVL